MEERESIRFDNAPDSSPILTQSCTTDRLSAWVRPNRVASTATCSRSARTSSSRALRELSAASRSDRAAVQKDV